MLETLVVVRAVHFAALYLTVGGAVFWIAVPPRSLRSRLPESAARIRHVIRIAAIVAVISGLAWFAAMIANMVGDPMAAFDPATLRAFFLETPFARDAAVRLVSFAALLASVARRLDGAGRLAPVALVGALLLASQAWLGHAAEGGAGFAGIAMPGAYIVHVVAGAIWLGGLLPLLLCLVEARRRDPTVGHPLLLRYGAMALAAAACVLASGVANTIFRLGTDASALLASEYGRVLVDKVVIVAAMLLLAAINRFVLVPRLCRAADRTLGTIIPLLVVDLALGMLVLAFAALLGVTSPPV